jgi:hypothetical protein
LEFVIGRRIGDRVPELAGSNVRRANYQRSVTELLHHGEACSKKRRTLVVHEYARRAGPNGDSTHCSKREKSMRAAAQAMA